MIRCVLWVYFIDNKNETLLRTTNHPGFWNETNYIKLWLSLTFDVILFIISSSWRQYQVLTIKWRNARTSEKVKVVVFLFLWTDQGLYRCCASLCTSFYTSMFKMLIKTLTNTSRVARIDTKCGNAIFYEKNNKYWEKQIYDKPSFLP